MTLQQDLLKAKWQECKDTKRVSHHFCKCKNTCIQPQIFDNELKWQKVKSNKELLQQQLPVYKSGDVIIICKCAVLISNEHHSCDCGEEDLQSFKVLRTLENNSKIEVVKI